MLGSLPKRRVDVFARERRRTLLLNWRKLWVYLNRRVKKVFKNTKALKVLISTGFISEIGSCCCCRPTTYLDFLFIFVVSSNKHYNSYNKYMWKNIVSIEYTALGFEPTTFGTPLNLIFVFPSFWSLRSFLLFSLFLIFVYSTNKHCNFL